VVTLYANGFTVDDGPFRSLVDPANKPFVDAMNQGFVPEARAARVGPQRFALNMLSLVYWGW